MNVGTPVFLSSLEFGTLRVADHCAVTVVDAAKMDLTKYLAVLVLFFFDGGETGGHGKKHQ